VKDGVRRTLKDRQLVLDDLVKAIREFRKFTDRALTLRGPKRELNSMCARYTSEEELARLYHIPIPSQTDLPISYNIAPSQKVLTI